MSGLETGTFTLQPQELMTLMKPRGCTERAIKPR
jgi:hypothetical protein